VATEAGHGTITTDGTEQFLDSGSAYTTGGTYIFYIDLNAMRNSSGTLDIVEIRLYITPFSGATQRQLLLPPYVGPQGNAGKSSIPTVVASSAGSTRASVKHTQGSTGISIPWSAIYI
jgi:hypothetical protein